MKNVYRKFIIEVSRVAFLLVSFCTLATNYTVSSDSEFSELSLVAGDTVIWLDGTYSDQQINWSGEQGTVDNPIVLMAETPGGVIFTGSSKVNFYGSFLIVDGFYWKGGEGANNHIEFRRNGSNSDFGNNCTIRNCAFDNLFTEEPDKSRWIVLYGSNNVVESCSFLNKESAGALVLVELIYAESTTPGHIIRNNYFYNITPKDDFIANSNDSETIRIGASSYQAISAQVVVEGNYFKQADGENEIISNKSADNTFRHNTFRNCRGSLVMRHGARAHVEGNFFLGEGKAKSGGIRISDRDHVIINNYMQGLNNDGDIWNNAITLVGGGAASGGTSNGYQNVDNVTIAHNTIYNSDDPIFFNDRNAYDPTGLIAYNLVFSENGDIVGGDIDGTGQGITYEGNIFGGSVIGITSDGILEGDAQFLASGETFKPSSTGIAADAAGATFKDLVNIDVEGLVRPNSNLDVGAHEVSGASGSIDYRPLNDSDVGVLVGACFIGADGSVLPECGSVGDYLIAAQVLDFDDKGETKSVNITSNIEWTASDDRDWISVSPNSGSQNGVIEVTVTENTDTAERVGNVVLTGEGVQDEVIVVSQLGYEPPIEVSGVSVSPEEVSLAPGGSIELSVVISPVDASNREVSFESSNSDVATVGESGIVIALAEGSATIMVTTDDGGFTTMSTINVLTPSSDFNWALNQPATGTGTADGANVPANLVDDDPASRWSVQGFPQSATVDLGGDITVNQTEVICYEDRAYQFIIEGSLTDDGDFSILVDRSTNSTPGASSFPIIDAVSDVTVRFVRITVSGASEYEGEWVSLTELRVFGEGEREDVAVTGVSLEFSSISLQEGETWQLTPTIDPSNATNQEVTFQTENSAIANVSDTGLITALKAGVVVITVTTDDGAFTSSVEVTVNSQEPVLNVADESEEGVWLTPNPTETVVEIFGAEQYQSAYVYDTAGKLVFHQKIADTKLIDVTGLRPGVYLVKLVGNTQVSFARLIRR